MRRAATYYRVSTDNQEAEGTSLQTQLEACLDYCRGKDYDVRYRFSETCSGLTLDRPKLNELRELVRAGDIDVVVVYCLDRLSRDPTHGVILTQELERHNVILEAVTEDIDTSELGKLISYIRGFASKLEAEKIRERTMRGRKARAKEGRVPTGGFSKLYGYDYIPVTQTGGGKRIINETEAAWVVKIFEWLVTEGMSTTAITLRLRALNAPTKTGKLWAKQTVGGIIKNPAYYGKTFAFTMERGKAKYSRPKEDWIELPGITPAIITAEVFEAAQRQLQVNRDKSPRNARRQYLLRGHLRCCQCGRSYCGHIKTKNAKGKWYEARRYKCTGTRKIDMPIDTCGNRSWSANKLEDMVWAELERYLGDRDLIISELEKQRQDANQLGVFEAELEHVERQLKAADREQHQLLQWALKGFPESQVQAENRRLNKAKETLKTQKTELEAQLKASQEAIINVPNLERFIENMQKRLPELDFEGKRLALDMLGITVWLDGENVDITGVIDPEESGYIATVPIAL